MPRASRVFFDSLPILSEILQRRVNTLHCTLLSAKIDRVVNRRRNATAGERDTHRLRNFADAHTEFLGRFLQGLMHRFGRPRLQCPKSRAHRLD